MSIFFFNDTATTEIYTLSLHDALPISADHPPEYLQGPDGGLHAGDRAAGGRGHRRHSEHSVHSAERQQPGARAIAHQSPDRRVAQPADHAERSFFGAGARSRFGGLLPDHEPVGRGRSRYRAHLRRWGADRGARSLAAAQPVVAGFFAGGAPPALHRGSRDLLLDRSLPLPRGLHQRGGAPAGGRVPKTEYGAGPDRAPHLAPARQLPALRRDKRASGADLRRIHRAHGVAVDSPAGVADGGTGPRVVAHAGRPGGDGAPFLARTARRTGAIADRGQDESERAGRGRGWGRGAIRPAAGGLPPPGG